MTRPKPHTLALEVDRTLKLNLSNGQFDILADLIDGYEDNKKFSKELMTKDRKDVLYILENLKEK